VLFIKIAV